MRFKGLILCALLVLWTGGVQAASVKKVQAVVPPATPQEAGGEVKPSVVAIVDVQRLLQTAKAARSVQEQLDAQRAKFQTEIAAEEKELRESEKELTRLRETAKPEAYVDQEQKLQQRFMTVERHVQARRKALDQGYTDAMNAVRSALVEVVSQIAKERGVNLVIVKQQVIWNDNVIDMTDEVLARLDAALPTLSATIDAEDIKIQEDKPASIKPKAGKQGTGFQEPKGK